MSMSKSKITFGLIGAFVLVALSSLVLVNADGGDGNSQTYAPARYALVSGPVLVNANGVEEFTQDAVLKIDTVTGQVWVLQLSIQSRTQPNVTAATFVPATNAPITANQ